MSSCPPRRRVAFTATRLRTEVNSSQYGVIDLSLKQFKICAQHLSTTMTSLTEESRLLERIYYKNKNQQRSSLFWKKVQEIRRFLLRILELKLEQSVEDLRYSFYDSEGSKILRTSWTKVPDLSFFLSLSKRLVGIGHLLKQINKRSYSILDALIQQLRTLAFVPLVLTVISIFSRFQYFIRRLQGDLQILWKSLTSLIQGLHTHELENKAKRLLNSRPFDADNREEDHTSLQTIEGSLSMAIDEDTGSRISKSTHNINTEDGTAAEDTPTSVLPVLPCSQSPSFNLDPSAQELNVVLEPSDSSIVRPPTDKGTPVRKRKRKKRDEIDAIFDL